MRHRLLRLGEVELAYDEHGSGGDALVLVHGYSGARSDFGDVARSLASSARVVALDHRGHGGSTWLRDDARYSIDLLASDLVNALDALGIERAHLVGHSMGGQIVLRTALARPERVRSLVLVATWAGELQIAETPALHTRAIDAVPFLRGAVDAVHRARGRTLHAAPPHVDPFAYRALRNSMRSADLRSQLARIDTPVTVLAGANDGDFVEHARTLARSIPGARLSILPHAGHQVMTERPIEFVEALRDHLRSVT